MTEPCSSAEEIAKDLGVAQDSIYRWLEAQPMPGHKVCRIWTFNVSEVDKRVRAAGAEGGQWLPSGARAKAKGGWS